VNSYGPDTYGEQIAGVYDTWFGAYDPSAIGTLHALAGTGPVLELGIGTGRIALPLRERGLAVHGIDASPAMVDRLRAKPGGDQISVTLGDFADVAAGGPFSLIYVVFNTFFALLSQDDQVRCFQNVARRLTPDGVFVIEAFVPDVARYSSGQTFRTVDVTTQSARLEATRHDPVQQRITSQHIVLTEQGIRLYPVQLRYAWPSELDLMARLAGMRLRERWGGWERSPFTTSSPRHISLYACTTRSDVG
jgi:SAM-dependent methyltransferase